ncbi:hypothetical protein G6F65_021386 [Rhizopus arrhizus]|nr:hypothetical protein G6F65_021386 [Rhizopus arrhizus]
MWACAARWNPAAAAANGGLRGWWQSSQTPSVNGRRGQCCPSHGQGVSALRQRNRQGSVCLPASVQLLRLEVERHFNAAGHGLAVALRRGKAPAAYCIGGGTVELA